LAKSDSEVKKSQRVSARVAKRRSDRHSRGRISLKERKSKPREYDVDEGPVKYGVDLEHQQQVINFEFILVDT
jgi:hypothetical protein